MERRQKGKLDNVYSHKVSAGKRRTYFFDVKKTKGDDYFITLTESTKRFDGRGFERHKLLLYKEDFNRFLAGLEDVISHVKNELMPDYDYEQFERRHEEWEAKKEEEKLAELQSQDTKTDLPIDDPIEDNDPEEDISW